MNDEGHELGAQQLDRNVGMGATGSKLLGGDDSMDFCSRGHFDTCAWGPRRWDFGSILLDASLLRYPSCDFMACIFYLVKKCVYYHLIISLVREWLIGDSRTLFLRGSCKYKVLDGGQAARRPQAIEGLN